MNADEQRRLILDQFTRQALPFSQASELSNEDVFRLLLDACGVRPDDTVLDLACGPGLTACALAGAAKQVTGLDITPAMIERAEALRQAKGLQNVAWRLADVLPLPFADAAFSLVFTRYSFHHFLDPRAVLHEMARACAPGGRVAVVDVYTTTAEQAEAYDRMERLRDPSHVRALGLHELTGHFGGAGLRDVRTTFYRLPTGLEELLAASFPVPGGADEVRRMVVGDVGVDRLGIGAYCADGAIRLSFPTVVVVGRKTGRCT
jgi:SAM-dependent methyltransferase